MNQSFRIIWNITNRCSYDCKICATNSGKNEKCNLTLQDKQLILLNLASINKNIESLDISGGDPLLDSLDRRIIQQCYHVLPFSKISITTTADGLDQVAPSEISSTVKCCDITYDIPCRKYETRNIGMNDEITDRPYIYNKSNLSKLIAIRESGLDIEINIHVPIHEVTTNEADIRLLLKDLESIHPKAIKFIRLMPVGRLNPASISDKYSPSQFMKHVENVMSEQEYDFKVSVSCAIKAQDSVYTANSPRTCPMLLEKLGIDSMGNVFACIWAAYLKGYKTIEENPYYLGSLLESTLYDILIKSHPRINYLREKYEGSCPVCQMAKETLQNQVVNCHVEQIEEGDC